MPDHSAVPIIWEGNPPEDEIVKNLRKGIKVELAKLDSPETLTFATIFVDEDKPMAESRTIIMWGDTDEPGVFFAKMCTPHASLAGDASFKEKLEAAMEYGGVIPPWKLN